MHVSHVSPHELKSLLSKVIRRQTEAVRPKVHQLAALVPHWPVDQLGRPAAPGPAGPVVGIEVVGEVQKVRQGRGGRVVVGLPVERLQDVAAVHGAQRRRAPVVRRQVRPAGHVGRGARGEVEGGAALEREDEVAEEGGHALELGVEVVVGAARVVGGAGGGVVRVQADQPRDVGVGVGQVELAEVALQLGGRADVGGEEGEERAFVLLVADDVGDFGVSAAQGGLIWRLRDERPVWPR